MPSLWPWTKDDQSPASFEKALSNLSAKISRTNVKLESYRQRSRRFVGLWTLYSIFAYLLYTIVLGLVVGWDQWGMKEYGAVTGGPAVIYSIRLLLLTYYSFRTSKFQSELDQLQGRRDSTIDRLKAATKYNTTQELLKKYGGAPPATGKASSSTRQSKSQDSQKSLTGLVPPPTANIPGRNVPISPPADQIVQPSHPDVHAVDKPARTQIPTENAFSPRPSAEFAPNAFAQPPQYAPQAEGPRWYDRILDVLLGDDETLPRNRLALICQKCRLVNGQAPPGVMNLEDVGKWRCISCGTMNGQESEASRIVATLREPSTSEQSSATPEKMFEAEPGHSNPLERSTSDPEQEGSDVTQYSDASENDKPDHKASGDRVDNIKSTPRRRSARIREMSEDP